MATQPISGIQFVTDSKGRKVAVQMDLRKHRVLWEDFSDALIATSRRKERPIAYTDYITARLKRSRG